MYQALQSKFITCVSELLLAINDTFIASMAEAFHCMMSFNNYIFQWPLFNYTYKVSKIIVIENQYNSQFF